MAPKRKAEAPENPQKIAKTESKRRLGFITRALAGENVAKGWSHRAELANQGEGEVFANAPDQGVYELLAALVPGSLGVLAADRDAYQTTMVEMIGKGLEMETNKLKDAVEHAEAANATADAKKTENETQTNNLEESLKTKTEEVSAKDEKLKSDSAAEKEKEKVVTAAEKEKADAAVDLEKAQEKKAAFEKAKDEAFGPLKDGPPENKRDKNKLISELARTLGKYVDNLEEALTLGIPIAFKLAPDQRKAFDQLLIDHVGKVLASELEACGAKLEAGEQTSAAVAAKVEAAKVELAAAKETVAASEEALKTAQKEQKELESQIKDSKKEAKHIGHEIHEKAEDHAKKLKVHLHYVEVLEMFAAQKEYALPVIEEPAAAAPAEEAAEVPVA